MTWLYVQRTGALYQDGRQVGHGYSGHGTCRNQPAAEGLEDLGPIPRGAWRIEGPPRDTATRGPYVLRLEAQPGTDALGRTGFLMHGDSTDMPGSASRGCVVMPREVREAVWTSGDRNLEVVAENPDTQECA